MAGKMGVATKSAIATGTDAKTLVQIVSGANHAVTLHRLMVSFEGVTATDEPILIELVRQSDAGTMSALTVVGMDDADQDTFDTSAQHTASVEPTGTGVIFSTYLHPQCAGDWAFNPYTDAPRIGTAAALSMGRLGVRVTADDDVNATVTVIFEE